MFDSVGVRELRQNLSRYLARVKDGETLTVTEHGRDVAALVPRGTGTEDYDDLVTRFGVTVPTESLEVVAARLPYVGAPAGTTDAFLAESRRERA
jgi:prevent-host-death family protein